MQFESSHISQAQSPEAELVFSVSGFEQVRAVRSFLDEIEKISRWHGRVQTCQDLIHSFSSDQLEMVADSIADRWAELSHHQAFSGLVDSIANQLPLLRELHPGARLGQVFLELHKRFAVEGMNEHASETIEAAVELLQAFGSKEMQISAAYAHARLRLSFEMIDSAVQDFKFIQRLAADQKLSDRAWEFPELRELAESFSRKDYHGAAVEVADLLCTLLEQTRVMTPYNAQQTISGWRTVAQVYFDGAYSDESGLGRGVFVACLSGKKYCQKLGDLRGVHTFEADLGGFFADRDMTVQSKYWLGKAYVGLSKVALSQTDESLRDLLYETGSLLADIYRGLGRIGDALLLEQEIREFEE